MILDTDAIMCDISVHAIAEAKRPTSFLKKKKKKKKKKKLLLVKCSYAGFRAEAIDTVAGPIKRDVIDTASGNFKYMQ